MLKSQTLLDAEVWNVATLQFTNFLFLCRSVQKGVDGILDEVFGPFKKQLKENFEAGFQNLRENEDKYSTRGKLAALNYDYFTIEWLETNDTYAYFSLSSDRVDESLTNTSDKIYWLIRPGVHRECD